jgi:hypothetical protein
VEAGSGGDPAEDLRVGRQIELLRQHAPIRMQELPLRCGFGTAPRSKHSTQPLTQTAALVTGVVASIRALIYAIRSGGLKHMSLCRCAAHECLRGGLSYLAPDARMPSRRPGC